jgi:hypothetical protein
VGLRFFSALCLGIFAWYYRSALMSWVMIIYLEESMGPIEYEQYVRGIASCNISLALAEDTLELNVAKILVHLMTKINSF